MICIDMLYNYIYIQCQSWINWPQRAVESGGTIFVSYCDYLEGTPTINKPWFINPELTLHPKHGDDLGKVYAVGSTTLWYMNINEMIGRMDGSRSGWISSPPHVAFRQRVYLNFLLGFWIIILHPEGWLHMHDLHHFDQLASVLVSRERKSWWKKMGWFVGCFLSWAQENVVKPAGSK